MSAIKGVNRRQFIAGSSILTAAALLPWSANVSAAVSNATDASGTPRKGGVLRISVDQAVGMLNPQQARVNPEYLVAELLYSGLTRLTQQMQAEADLAQSWKANDTLNQWTFILRPSLRFHDGSPCTASDVVASLQAVLDSKNASPGQHNIGPITQVTAVDANTVQITTDGPYADLPVMLAYPDAKIIPAAIAAGQQDRLSKEAIGTGPFKLVSYAPDRLIVVERNPYYYDPQRPYLDRVEVVVYPDAIAEGSALIAGDTDLMLSAASTEFERLSKAPGVQPLRVASGLFLNVNMGCDVKPFNDVRVRQALALCVDRAATVDFVAEGYGTPGNDAPLNNAYPYYLNQTLKAVDYSKAKALLAEAGYPNGLDLTGCDVKPFNDVRVRQALALCVDRAATVDFVAEGYGTPGNDAPLNNAYPYYLNQTLKAVDYSKAKALLAEAGYPNGLDLTLIASDKPSTRTQLGIALREMAKPGGFRITVQTMAHSTYLDQVWKKGNFYVGFYNMQPTPDAVFSLLYTSTAAWNETRWNNAEFDQAIKTARETADSAKRTELYGTAQKLMHDQVPSLIPTFFDLLAASRSYVSGYQLHPRGAVFRLDHVWLAANAPLRK